MKLNGYEVNYNQVFIYDDNCNILFQTERPVDLKITLEAPIRNARKLMLNKGDCFEVKTSGRSYSFMRNGKDLYIHNSFVDVVKVEERVAFNSNGETNYKNYYTLRMCWSDNSEVEAQCDFYTRTEKTEERTDREKLAEIISSCLYGNKYVSHYEVEEMLKKLNITIKGE